MNLQNELYKWFGYKEFRQGQEEVIQSVLKGKDTIAMLPTGTGKSLCYQLPAYITGGTVLVVSPLLSLMQDQVEHMKVMGEKKVVALNSFLDFRERIYILNNLGKFRFIFISPEMLMMEKVIEKLRNVSVSLFVVDEAHCISQWGHDFRPDYQRLGEVRNLLGSPSTLALTATGNREVREDIKGILRMEDCQEIVYSADRPNISLAITHVSSYPEKMERLLEFVSSFQKPGIIYFSSKKMAEETAEWLIQQGLHKTSFYHGGMEQEQRILIQQQFLHGQLDIICATSAFGMGINKPDIRFVMHFHLPASAEAYLQEIGRAGRDGERSIAMLLYSPGDEGLLYQMIDSEMPSDYQVEEYFKQAGSKGDQELMDLLGLNEIHFRFLSFYKQVYINKNRDLSPGDNGAASFVKKIRDIRTENKRMKIGSMTEWAVGSKCRRQGILNMFGEELRGKQEKCCDTCGLDFSDYEGNNIQDSRMEKSFTWEEQLYKMLLNGSL
ncbi:ATP-dependent DNA helicase RecQ [Rossellomorea vietnamensis]|uniref:ATP-dependent DNA helicase RecQ n=1 Tax=Rossellomorea vietnamensis TaxID=218284 RepID=A0A5D4MFZ8_9BACI|nr:MULTISPECIES: ATP-dependent DNA helicase RecQ [Bacillaceae]TYS00582.1 ATP-dependent DNA helicase RecQ [Rossellomorea vietnamensis]